jgi:hypothetical protein
LYDLFYNISELEFFVKSVNHAHGCFNKIQVITWKWAGMPEKRRFKPGMQNNSGDVFKRA